MKTFFDTSVLVAAVVDQLPQHERARSFLLRELAEGVCCCSTHVLAECYATLTALPLKRRVQPLEARALIEENFVEKLALLNLGSEHYRDALRKVSDLGLRSGVVYDALHLCCAESEGCEKLATFNLKDFNRLSSGAVTIASP